MTNLSDLVEILAKQALGGQQQNNQQNTGLGGVLGSVLGQVLNQQTQQRPQQNNQSAGGLGGILGAVLGQIANNNAGVRQGSAPSGGKSALLIAVLPVILAWIQKQGGIQGALDKLKNAGMGTQVQSWVSPEDQVENQHVPSEQMELLFDKEDVDEIVTQTQQPKQNVYAALATALPQIIDSLTPHGDGTNKQEADNDIQNVLKSISDLIPKR